MDITVKNEGLVKYFCFVDAHWRQFATNHPKATITKLQDIIHNSWYGQKNPADVSKKQVVTKKVKKAKTRAKAKEIKIFEGNGLKNPYLQNLLKKVETGKESLKDEDETKDIDQTKENNYTAKETHLIKNAKTAQKEVAIEPEDSDRQ